MPYGSGPSTPPAGSGTTAPYGSGPSTPPAGSGTTAPYGSGTTAPYGSGTTAPYGSGPSTPPAGSGTTAPYGSGTTAPYGSGPSTPPAGSGTTGPGPGNPMPANTPYGPAPSGPIPSTMPGTGPGPGSNPQNPYGTGMPGYGPQQPGQAPPKPATWADKAEALFRMGRDREALAWLYAYAVTADKDAADETLKKMGWLAPHKHPAFAVRWGVGVELNPKNWEREKVYPVGTTQNVPTKRGPQGGGTSPPPGTGPGGMPGYPGGPGAGAGQPNQLLQQLTGELGQRLLQQLQERAARGDLGQVYAAQSPAKPDGTGANMPYPGGPSAIAPSGHPPGAGPQPYGQPAMAPGPPGEPNAAQSLAPGVVLLGQGTVKDLRKKAAEIGVDVVCIFTVNVTFSPRANTFRNDTVILIYDSDSTAVKEAYKTKLLNNIAVQLERAQGDTDSVTKEFEGLFKYIDANWLVGELPAALQAEHVLNRLRGLLAESPDNPLPVLAEIRMYHARGLLEEKNLAIAYNRLLGDQLGKVLAAGTEEEKKKAVEKWLPKER